LAIRFIETTSRYANPTRGAFDRIGGIKQEYIFRVSEEYVLLLLRVSHLPLARAPRSVGIHPHLDAGNSLTMGGERTTRSGSSRSSGPSGSIRTLAA